MNRRTLRTRWKALCAAGVLLLAITGAFVSIRTVHRTVYSSDWSGDPVLTATRSGNRLDLVAIDRLTASSRRLLRLPVSVQQGVAPDTAVLRESKTELLVLVTGADGFQAHVIGVDTSRHTARSLGDIAAGRYAALVDGMLAGVTAVSDSARADAARVELYRLPSLERVRSTALPLVPTAGTAATCLAGQASNTVAAVTLSYPRLV
jgi:hypothetical protein